MEPGSTAFEDVLAAAWRRRRGLEAIFVLGVLGVVLAASAWLISLGAQMTWDAAVYASKARSLTTAIPASNWFLYRPPGLPYLGLLAAPFGYSDVTLRLVSASAGVATIAASWALARQLWGAFAAALALLVLAANPLVLGRLPVFRNDLVSVGPLVLLLILLWWQLERRHAPNAFLVLAAPLVAASFYLRFGSLPLIVGVIVATIVLWGGKLWHHRVLGGTTVLFTLALLIPHVVEAVARTGSPLGIVRSAVGATDTTSPLTAVRNYLAWLSGQIASRVGIGFLIAAGVFAVVAASESIRARLLTPDARRLSLLLVPAAVGAAGIILISHPEPRYMIGPLILTTIAGCAGVAEALHRLALRMHASVPVQFAGTVGILAVLGLAVVLAGGSIERQIKRAADRQWLSKAGNAIAADAAGPCIAVTTQVPIIGWYSHCLGVSFHADLAAARAQLPAGTPAYVVFTSRDGPLARPGELARYRDLAREPPIASIVEDSGSSTVYRLP